MKWLITGGAGFIGVNLIRQVLASHPEDAVVNFDNLASLRDIETHPRHRSIRGDITRPEDVECSFELRPDVVVHLAAESHVDRSILAFRSVTDRPGHDERYTLDSHRIIGELRLQSGSSIHSRPQFWGFLV